MASQYIMEWLERQEQPPPPGFPKAQMGNNIFSEALKILSLADRDEEAGEIAKKYVTNHHRLDPDIFLTLVEIGDIPLAVKMLPKKGEKLMSWRGEGLRTKLIDQLPAFYEAMNNPALQLQIESGIIGLMTDGVGDFRPQKEGLLGREQDLIPLLSHLKELSLEEQVVTMAYFAKHPAAIKPIANDFESLSVSYPLLELYGGAVPGEWAFYYRVNLWTARVVAAYYREDWELCRELCEQLVELDQSRFKKECGGTVVKVIARLNVAVLDQLMDGEEHDFAGAARFWGELCDTITPMTNVTNWTSRGRSFAYYQILSKKAGEDVSFKRWLATIPPVKAKIFQEVPQYSPGYSIVVALNSNDPRWSQGPDRGAAFRREVLHCYFSDLDLLGLEYGFHHTFPEYLKRGFLVEDLRNYIDSEEGSLQAKVYLLAILGRYYASEEKGFQDRIVEFESYLKKLPDGAKFDPLRELMRLSIAEAEMKWGAKQRASDLLAGLKNGEYKNWAEELKKSE